MFTKVLRIGMVAVIALGVVVLSSPTQAQTKVRVGKAVGGNFAFLGADVGVAAGIFKKYGLDLEIVNFNGSAKLQQGLAAGAVDFGLGSGPEMAFIAKGAPNIAVAVLGDLPRTMMLVVRKDGPVNTLEDLKDRRISCTTAGSLTDWLGHELSNQMGWGPNGFNMTPLGSTSAQTAALRTNQIDGMIVPSTAAFNAEEANIGKILVRFGDRFKHFHVHVIYARNEVVAKTPNLVRKFLRAWFESIKYMADHKAETIEIAQKITQMSKSVAERSYNELMPMFNRTGQFDSQALAILAKSYVDMHILPSKPDMSKLYTEKFLPGTR